MFFLSGIYLIDIPRYLLQGDSGGPFQVKRPDNRWSVFGLASWVYGECGGEMPDAYTNVSHFLEWIDTNIN